MSDKVSIAIIGGGALGLAVAHHLLSRGFKDIVLLEKNDAFGLEQSGSNSGVIHAGFLYPPETLMAGLCVEGTRLLYEFCRKYGVPYKKTGKVVVAADEEQEKRPFFEAPHEIVSAELVEVECFAPQWYESWQILDDSISRLVAVTLEAPSEEKRRNIKTEVTRGWEALGKLVSSTTGQEHMTAARRINPLVRQTNKFHRYIINSWGEVYLALAQGVADAMECGFEFIYPAKFNEVAKYITRTNHLFGCRGAIIGKVSYDKLPAEMQTALKEACLAYVPEAVVNDYVMIHVGFAISHIDEEEAQRTFELLREIEAIGEELGKEPPAGST